MAEQVESICIPFTYTYDQFTTFFYDGRVYLSDTSYPIGQCCVDVANMDEEVLDEIDRRVEEFIPAAQALLSKKTNSVVAFAQKKLNAVWDIIFTMPVYRDLNMDLKLSYHLLERLYEQKEKWTQVQDIHSEGHEIYERMIDDLAHFSGTLCRQSAGTSFAAQDHDGEILRTVRAEKQRGLRNGVLSFLRGYAPSRCAVFRRGL